MALEQADLEQIERVVKDTMQASMADHPIKCPIPPEWASSIGHFAGMVQDIGKGDTRQGVENIRRYLQAVDNFLTMRGKLSAWITRSLVGSAILGLGTGLVLLFKYAIKGWLGK
jgi:hypothetical protein